MKGREAKEGRREASLVRFDQRPRRTLVISQFEVLDLGSRAGDSKDAFFTKGFMLTNHEKSTNKGHQVSILLQRFRCFERGDPNGGFVDFKRGYVY